MSTTFTSPSLAPNPTPAPAFVSSKSLFLTLIFFIVSVALALVPTTILICFIRRNRLRLAEVREQMRIEQTTAAANRNVGELAFIPIHEGILIANPDGQLMGAMGPPQPPSPSGSCGSPEKPSFSGTEQQSSRSPLDIEAQTHTQNPTSSSPAPAPLLLLALSPFPYHHPASRPAAVGWGGQGSGA